MKTNGNYFKGTLLIGVMALIGSLVTEIASAQNWYDTDWQYRREITITNPAGTALTSFQVQIKLDNSFDYTKAEIDGNDILFTEDDGITPIPSWIEYWDNPDSAGIWIKVPDIPVTQGTVFMYYGNSMATGSLLVEVPPSGPYTNDPANIIIPGGDPGSGDGLLAEQIVYDNVTGHYWLPFSAIRSGQQVAMAWSDDPTDPTSWTWDGYKMSNAFSPHLILYSGTWYLFYGDRSQGSPYPVSVATSSSVNGPFTYLQTVLQPSETWEGSRLDQPHVFQRNDGKWILMYMGDLGLGSGNANEHSGYATADNITGPYTKYAGNPVLDFGPLGSYDLGGAGNPWVYEFNGVYYIGYTVSHTTSTPTPWRTGWVTTTDWITFNKHGYLLTGANEFNCFRGAVTRINDTYVFPYTTRSSGTSAYQMAIASQPVYLNIINNPDAVFDFYDGFDGTSLDLRKWSFRNGLVSQASVGSGLLTLTATTTWIKIDARKWLGMDYIQETHGRHPNQGASNLAAEVGFADYSWNTARIVDDFDPPGTVYWQRQANIYGGSGSITNMAQTADQNWHIFSVYRQTPNIAGFQIDDTPVETDNTNVPTMILPPFHMSYGNTNQFITDWTRVRKWAGSELTATVGNEQGQAPFVDIAIYNTGCGKFDIRLRPDKDITDSYLTDVRFSVKWLISSGVTLENINNSYGIDLISTTSDLGYYYALFGGTNLYISSWTAGNEYTVLTFDHTATGSGYSDFGIADDTYAQSNSMDYYAELTSADATGVIYRNALNVYLGRCGEIKVLLQGPYGGGGMMSKGLTGNVPLAQPYTNVPPWNYTGSESLTETDASVIDWVLVELRSDATTTVEKKAALLLEDGMIAQYNNIEQGVHFDNTVDGSTYYIVVWHRNHMPVMTSGLITFDGTLVDFTNETICYGSPNAEIELETDIYGMIAGDVTANGKLKYSGPGNDRGAIIAKIVDESGSNNINGYLSDGYWYEDVNLNDTVLYIGSDNDRAYINLNLNTLVGPELYNIYTSVVPGAVTGSKDQGTSDGSFDILITESISAVNINVINNESLKNGLVDNIQFTLAWKADDNEILDLLNDFTSGFMLTTQGDIVEAGGINHLSFASVTPVNLPQTFNKDESVTVMSFENPAGISIADRLWIANDEFTASHNGMYYVSVWGTDNTGTILSSPLGINGEAGISSVRIYPNPVTSGIVHVEMNLEKTQDVTIMLVDIHGKLVTSEVIRVNTGISNNQINLHNISKGMYYIKIQSEGFTEIRKLILLQIMI